MEALSQAASFCAAAKGRGKKREKPQVEQLSFEDYLFVSAQEAFRAAVPPPAVVLSEIKEPAKRFYRLGEDEIGGRATQKERFRWNVEAISLLKKLEAEDNRDATADEQAVLVKYVGWGGVPQAFHYSKDWQEEYDLLEKLLSEEDYESARASTPNAHYTSPKVIRFMYEVVQRMGFKGGRIIEPALGIGHFFGLMPTDLLAKSKVTGVELDSLSGRIARKLYPDADIRIAGFETTKLPDNFFDLAISNVPFGDYKVHDPRYTKHKFSIHDYFFAKSLDLVRPGGIVAFVTSRYTMDKKDLPMREYMHDRADFLGAVRLPNTAFRNIANTEVTADVIFLQKREAGAIPQGHAWNATKPQIIGEDEAFINEYFIENPDMMLGTLVMKSGMHGRYDVSLESDGRDIAEALNEKISSFPGQIFIPDKSVSATKAEIQQSAPAPDYVKEGAFVIVEGKLYSNSGGQLLLLDLSSNKMRRIEKMIGLRDAVRELLYDEMRTNDEASVSMRRAYLSSVYDYFVKKFGFIHARDNRAAFSEDPDYPLLLSLEHWDEDKKTSTKADIFTKRVIHPVKQVESVETVKEAFLVTLNELGSVDFRRMSQLCGKDESEIKTDLEGIIFKNPQGGWETADEYLSGNVKEKLQFAESAAQVDSEFQKNVDALKAVQPKDLDFSEIHVNLGAPWIPPQDIEKFVNELLDVPEACKVAFAPVIGAWTISIEFKKKWPVQESVNNTKTWGTSRCDSITLMEDALNNRIPTVRDAVDDKFVVNVKETEAAREKLYLIKEHFRKWVWQDAERRTRLVQLYNDKFNNLRQRKFDGSHLTLPGMTSHITLNPHQKDGVWRIIQTGNTLLAHIVGSGKTYVCVAAAMEMKRLGLVTKPLITVPNHLLEQWAAEFLRLYPLANVLIARVEDLSPLKRKAFMAKVATSNWDAVIVAHTSFEKLPISKEAVALHIQRQIDDLEKAILEADDERDSGIVKRLEKAKKRLETKLKDRVKEEKKDDCLTFEELGVDMILVDEADLYKNLFFATKMTRVAGLPNSESQRAFDMYVKSQWCFFRKYPVVFGTGTPVSNTMAEIFTIQRYLQPDKLEEYGIQHFDSWAQNFGEAVTSLEIAPDGSGYRMRTRFARFINIPELMQIFRLVADVQTDEMLNLEKPALKGGKPIVVAAPASITQKKYVESLVKRAEVIRGGHIDPRIDNMLKITTDGRKSALDMRLIEASSADETMSKVNESVRRVYDIWESTAESKTTQLVFCDMSTPNAGHFNVYEDMRDKLVKMGIPQEEIAFIHDADTDLKKKALFVKVNFGRIRILFGSTAKMGAGTNVQRLLGALHHLDAPWRPRDMAQREGRILRQGNKHKEVSIFRYVTEGSFDAYMFQTIEAKARFIAQIMTDKITARSAEDIEGVVLSYAEVKALASGNPLVMEKFKVDIEVNRLETLYSQYQQEKWRMEYDYAALPGRLETQRKYLERLEKDLSIRVMPTEFSIEIDGTVFSERKAAGDAIIRQAHFLRGMDRYEKIGSYSGFELYIKSYALGHLAPSVIARGAAEHTGTISDSEVGTIASLDHALRNIERQIADTGNSIEQMEKKYGKLSEELAKPFPYDEKLRELLKKQYTINKELDLDKSERTSAVEDGEEELPKAA